MNLAEVYVIRYDAILHREIRECNLALSFIESVRLRSILNALCRLRFDILSSLAIWSRVSIVPCWHCANLLPPFENPLNFT